MERFVWWYWVSCVLQTVLFRADKVLVLIGVVKRFSLG